MGYNIAIDGPAGAGKSTIARKLAEKTGFIYVDTGAMYRAMAVYFMEHKIDPMKEEQINKACKDIHITINYVNEEQIVYLNNENINTKIRREAVGKMASATSGYKQVREHLRQLQQTLAKSSNVIMDGRDIGTCILPEAQLKIYLTASVDTRAQRRYQQLLDKGEPADLQQIKKDIKERDEQDMTRKTAPLKQAEDAVLVDTSAMGIDDVVEFLYKLYEDRI
ncbi:MAG: (d)CMP kinase [Lachnospiraceae bacterium]